MCVYFKRKTSVHKLLCIIFYFLILMTSFLKMASSITSESLFANTSSIEAYEVLSLYPATTEIIQSVGSSLIVTCRSHPYPPVIKIQWIDPQGKEVTISKGRIHKERRLDQLSLIFESIKLTDRGTWTCQTHTKQQKAFELRVFERITFSDDQMEGVVAVPKNRDVTIKCKAEGYPEPLVLWYKDGFLIKFPHKKYISLSDALLIKNVMETDEGEYICRAIQISPTVSEEQVKIIELRLQSDPITMKLLEIYADGVAVDIRTTIGESSALRYGHYNNFYVEYIAQNNSKNGCNWSLADKTSFEEKANERYEIRHLERRTLYCIRAAIRTLDGSTDFSKVIAFTTSNSKQKQPEFNILSVSTYLLVIYISAPFRK